MKGWYCESMSRICIKSFFASHSQLFRNQKWPEGGAQFTTSCSFEASIYKTQRVLEGATIFKELEEKVRPGKITFLASYRETIGNITF